MTLYRLVSLMIVVAALFFNACSSSPAKKTLLTSADSSVIAEVVASKMAQMTAKQAEAPLPQNLDSAHMAFVRAMDLEIRGESSMAKMFWQQAAEFDPYSRFLTFKMADILQGQGADSLALVQAARGQKLKGKVTSSQLGLLAHLYVRMGIADSSRKYFNIALDSSHYQDMSLLYDYSLFLEAVKDTAELVRVYDLLLPQVNYTPSLLRRQLELLVETGRDSAVVELFGKAHEVSGDKDQLARMVHGLVFQNRMDEARAIIDTLTESTPEDESMIVLFMDVLADKDFPAAYALLKKKYYADSVRTPALTNLLGQYGYVNGDNDSAKVLLLQSLPQLLEQPSYVNSTYRALTKIALAEKNMKDAVVYAEKVDSVSNGNGKALLAVVYGSAKMYDKAYQILDSLVAFWDNWVPIKSIADPATYGKLNQDAEANKLLFRTIYASNLTAQASEIYKKYPCDSVKQKPAFDLWQKAQEFYDYIVKVDTADVSLRFFRAINMERLGRLDEAFAQFDILLDTARFVGLDVPEVLNYYGYTLIDKNRSAEEVERGYKMVLEALALEKDGPSEAYLDSKAWGLYRMGRHAEALAVMELIKGKQLLEDYIYWEHLGAIYEALGNKAAASATYKKLLKMCPKNPAALRFLKGAKK